MKFTAAQAAQKCYMAVLYYVKCVHCRTGSSEKDAMFLKHLSQSSLPHRQLRNTLSYQILSHKKFTAAQAAQKLLMWARLCGLMGSLPHRQLRNEGAPYKTRDEVFTAAQAAQKLVTLSALVVRAVHCRTGSSEIDNFVDLAVHKVHCRTGSSEKQERNLCRNTNVHCRTGSSETNSAGQMERLNRSLPHRQLRKARSMGAL